MSNKHLKDLLSKGNSGSEQVEDDKYFSFERKERVCFMVELRLKSGKSVSFPYHLIQKIEYDITEVVLYLSDTMIKIRGRNLDKLYSYFLRHRVKYVQEHNSSGGQPEEEKAFIENISILEV